VRFWMLTIFCFGSPARGKLLTKNLAVTAEKRTAACGSGDEKGVIGAFSGAGVLPVRAWLSSARGAPNRHVSSSEVVSDCEDGVPSIDGKRVDSAIAEVELGLVAHSFPEPLECR
jgi:hypothetical protein